MNPKKLKSGFIRIIVLFGSILAILLLLMLFLTIAPGEQLLTRMLESILSKRFNHRVTIEKVETNLVSRVQIYGISVDYRKNGVAFPFIRLSYGQINYNIRHLKNKILTIQSIVTDSLMIYVEQDSSGQWWFPRMSSDDPLNQKSSFQFNLNRLLIENSSIYFQNSSIPVSGSITGLDVTVQSDENQNYYTQVHAAALGLLYRNIPIEGEDFIARAFLSREIMRLDSLSLQISDLAFTGSGALRGQSLSGQFRIYGNPGDILSPLASKFASEFYPVKGNVNLVFDLNGTINEPKGRMQLVVPRMICSSLELTRSRIIAWIHPDRIDIKEFIVHFLGGAIRGTGFVQYDSIPEYRFELKTASIRLDQLWQIFYHRESPFRGYINATIQAKGHGIELENQEIDANLAVSEMAYQSKPYPDMIGRFILKEGNGFLNFRQDESELSSMIRFSDQFIDGHLNASIKNLSPFSGFFGVIDLSGSLGVVSKFHGCLRSPEIEAVVSARNVKFQNFPVDTLEGKLFYVKDRLSFDKLCITGKCGSIDTLKPPFFLSELRGGFEYEITADGPIDNLFAELKMDLTEPGYHPVRFNSGNIHCQMKENRIRLMDCRFAHDSLTFLIRGEAMIPLSEGSIDLQIFQSQEEQDSQQKADCGKISLIFDLSQKDFFKLRCFGSRIELGKILSIVPQHRQIDGEAEFQWTFQGNRFFPDSDFRFSIYHPSYEKVNLDSLRGNLQLRENILSIERLSFYLGQHESWIESRFDLDRREDNTLFISDQSQIRGKAQGSKFRFESLNPFMPSRIKLNGMGRYDLSWHGNLRSPRITGQMVIEEGAFQYGMNNEPIQKIEFRGSFKDTVFQVESLKGMVKQIPFNLKALLIAHQNRDIDLEWNLAVSNQENILTGKGLVTQDSIRFISSINRFNLNLLQPTLSSIDQFDGICSSELEINGLRDDPEINGSFNINQFSCNLPTITSKCHQGYVALRFRNNRITVDSVGCFLNEGFCILNGYADYDMGALVGADFHLKTEQLILQHSGEWTLRIHSGDLHYTGQNKSYILEGDLILGESWLFTGFKPQNIITFFRTVEKPEIVYPDLFQQTRIRIGITNSDKVWIDNNLARLRLQPEVTLIGSLAQPNLTGRISAREGYLLYLDRKFRVAHGLLDFIDPNKVNPIVDVEAQTNLKPYQTLERIPYSITLRVTGPIQEAKTELVSEPSLDKLDIIALLTLGATRQRLSGRDSEKQSVSLGNVLKDRLAGISSDRISSYTTEKIGNLLGLEDMSIEGNLFKFGKSWGPQLVASKKITNRMEVSYTTTVGHSNDQGIRLNYYLNKKISLQGQTDQRGRSAIDLKYGLKFK